jgi:hypothetical protein
MREAYGNTDKDEDKSNPNPGKKKIYAFLTLSLCCFFKD